MNRHRKSVALLSVLLPLTLIAAACGDDEGEEASGGDSPTTEAETSETTEPGDSAETTEPEDSETTEPADSEGEEGGEIVDLGTFVGDPPEHIDPALNTTLDAYQLIDLLYDGLTEVDYGDPENPEVVGIVAESFEPNEDATEWVFTLREGLTFSDGDPVLPSSFQRAWERATDPDFAGDYSYLYNFIEGGEEKLAGDAEEISGIAVDDDAMTLTVTMSAPYANFDAVAGFQTFFPMPSAVDDLADQSEWENGLMIGNGPYMLSEPRTDTEINVERNESWGGDYVNDRAKADTIRFVVSQDPDSAYSAFEAGEGDTANIPPGRVQDAVDNYDTTLDVGVLGTYYFEINDDDPVVGGEANVDLRKAISLAIDRDQINEAVYNGTREIPSGITPPGIPGFEEDVCEFCQFDAEAAQEAFDAWTAAGNSLDGPLMLAFNAGAGHEDVVQIIIDNLDAIGIPSAPDPRPSETYFTELSDGQFQIGRAGWFADYPTYDNFMYDLFHSDAIGGNNHGRYSNPEFDALIDEAKSTTDVEAAGELYREAEGILLNTDVGVIPVNTYKGDYVFDGEKLQGFVQSPLGIVNYDEIVVAE